MLLECYAATKCNHEDCLYSKLTFLCYIPSNMGVLYENLNPNKTYAVFIFLLQSKCGSAVEIKPLCHRVQLGSYVHL